MSINVGMNLKNQLRLYIDHKGISMAWISKKSGVALSTLHGWASGVEPKDIKKLRRVAEVLETNIDWLCFGKGIQNVKPNIKDFEAELSIGTYEVVLRKAK